ncbi:hypothetical protein [Hwangdonia sp.]|uniref:hypothetical protein n=1 Tax=Hwangdonia sp. TaxID=1883432 RepID=UPI003AB1CE08
MKRLPLLILFLFLIQSSINAQDKTKTDSIHSPTVPSIEKIYLHTDRSCYTVGESLWYKAYSVYAYTNVLFDNSNLLYVELISPESKIIARNIIKLESGLGHGDFKLTDSLGVSAGKYQLRAYTNWMRNFGEDFVFKKEIEVIDISKKDSLAPLDNDNLLQKPNNQETSANKKTVNVQFFPEGGTLIEGVASVVAFKATNSRGQPTAVKGRVFDAQKNDVTIFRSIHDGMGKFVLTPNKNEEYSVEIIDDANENIKFKLPKVETHGYTLSSKIVKENNVITIKTNQSTLNSNPGALLTLTCKAKGITYFEGTQRLEENSFSFILAKEDLPEGIIQITLYDQTLKPYSERLVYNEKDNDIDVTLKLNKEQYAPKEKVNLSLTAKTKKGAPVAASFSLASVDENGIDKKLDNGMNICSYFLLESDIKGTVHNPEYYFNRSNRNRLRHLDLLLLTQGWRDFLWKKLPIAKMPLKYNLEKGITISGSVRTLFGNTPKANSRVSMVLMNNGKSILLDDVTNVDGEFEFNDIVFKGSSLMMLNAQNEKGKNRGTFLLDSLFNNPIKIDYQSTYTPSLKSKTMKQSVYKKHVNFNVPIENVLDEVVIMGKKKNERKSKYGNADKTYIVEENTPNFSNIYQFIQYAMPGVLVSGNSIKFNSSNGPALILIDEVVAEMGDLEFIHPDHVAKIESIKSSRAAVFGSQGANGAILIYIKEGSSAHKRKKAFHSITKLVHGFYDARVFYSPNYEKPDPLLDQDADIRNTLYWNPYVHPDENGLAEMSYFNSEVNNMDVRITVEGITDTGVPIVVEKNYRVED